MYAAMVFAAYAVIAIAAVVDVLPAWAVLTFASIPLAAIPVRTIFTQTEGPPLIGVLKATARLQLAFAALLAIGVLIAA
jgi:1,4-dihydroxy-2-naphthoate octaprenyltransferase